MQTSVDLLANGMRVRRAGLNSAINCLQT